MTKRRKSNRRHQRGRFIFLYKLLSFAVICVALAAALTLFFRVDSISVSGQGRYTEEEIRKASGVGMGDNLYLLNKNDVVKRIQKELPYIEKIRINRDLPDTLVISVEECGRPVSVLQEGAVWLVSPGGKVVDRLEPGEAEGYPTLTGCELLAPTVGTRIKLQTDAKVRQTSLLELLAALEEAGMLEELDGIRMDDAAVIRMDYAGRFTVKMPYGADYQLKLRTLKLAMESEVIQDNMTGTFDMMREDGRTYLDQSVRE